MPDHSVSTSRILIYREINNNNISTLWKGVYLHELEENGVFNGNLRSKTKQFFFLHQMNHEDSLIQYATSID